MRSHKCCNGTDFLAVPPCIASSVATTGDININEIMYDPVGSEYWYEWVELYNNDTIPINITGWTIDDRTISEKVMPPGDYVVLSENKTAFEARYGTLPCQIIEVGQLTFSNTTEDTLVLKNATGVEIDTVTSELIAAENYTLELNATGGWKESRVEGGTSCQLNSVLAGEVPTADSLGVEDASGSTGTYVGLPVNIINVTSSPVQGIRLRVDYNESVLNLTNISKGDLTSAWTHLQLGEDRHTMVIATTKTEDAIPIGSTGSVVLLNFSVGGSPGDTSPMSMTLIELFNPDGEVGTAPAWNGTFTVKPPTPTPSSSEEGGGSGGGGGAFLPLPSPTLTPYLTATPVPAETSKLAPTVTPPTATAAQVPVMRWFMILIAIFISVIIVLTGYLLIRKRSGIE